MAAVNPMDVIKSNPELFKFKDEKSLLSRGVSLLTGLAIVVVAHVIGTIVRKYINKIGEEAPVPERAEGEVPITSAQATTQEKKTKILFVVIGHFVYYGIMIFAFMLVFKIVGLETTGLLAIIGAAGFAIGLALQGVLSDIAAGILIAIFQIYTIGEIIDFNGKLGRVKDFTLFHTILLDVPTNTTITIPNRKIQEGPINNLSRQKVHYAAVDVLVSNKNKDFNKILQIIREAAQGTPGILQNVQMSVFVLDIGTGGTSIRAKVPISSKNIVLGTGRVKLAILNALARNNIEMLDCVV